MVYSYLRGGSRFLLWICGSGEVGELLWRGDLEFYTGAVGFSGFKGSGRSYRYWYGGTGQLRSSAIFTKRGTQNFESSGRRHESDNIGVSLVKVLVGEAGNSFYGSRLGGSFLCSVEVWSRIPRVYGFVDSVVDI